MSNLVDSTNLQYHSDRAYLSSSMLKLILKSPEEFYNKWFGPQQADAEKDVFTEGSFVHTLLLEPQKVMTDYAVFEGLRKQGKAWECFKQDNPGKVLLSAPQVRRCEELAQAALVMPVAMKLLTGGLPEHTMTSAILDSPVKARADYINIEAGYIVDVKTTSMPSDVDIFRMTVEQYMYQLSAALYCGIAASSYHKPFDFYFIVLSKTDKQCHVYKASPLTLAAGHAMVNEAIVKYKHCLKTGDWSNASSPGTSFSSKGYEIEEV